MRANHRRAWLDRRLFVTGVWVRRGCLLVPRRPFVAVTTCPAGSAEAALRVEKKHASGDDPGHSDRQRDEQRRGDEDFDESEPAIPHTRRQCNDRSEFGSFDLTNEICLGARAKQGASQKMRRGIR